MSLRKVKKIINELFKGYGYIKVRTPYFYVYVNNQKLLELSEKYYFSLYDFVYYLIAESTRRIDIKNIYSFLKNKLEEKEQKLNKKYKIK